MFAVHPINVESVAWVAERKNALSTFFWLLTMLFYVWYAKKPDWKRYLPLLISFALGLMSKPMLVTLPFVLLLMDYWPLKRMEIGIQTDTEVQSYFKAGKVRLSFLILEKIPLFILTALSIGVTIYAAQSTGITIAQLDIVPLSQSIFNALTSYVLYLKKLFWPADLTVFYPLREILPRSFALAAVLLIIITAACCRYFKRYPYLSVGWFWYLGTLVPVIGIVQVGSQSLADRYAYVPFIGMFIALTWLAADVIQDRISRKIVAVLVITLLTGLSIAAFYQTAYWNNSFDLYQRALQVTNGNFLAHVGVGNELIKRNKIDEAIAHFQASIKMNPKNPANYLALAGLGKA